MLRVPQWQRSFATISFALTSCSNSPRDVVACGATGYRRPARRRDRAHGSVPRKGTRGDGALPRRWEGGRAKPFAMGRLAELLGHGRRDDAEALDPRLLAVCSDKRGIRGALIDLEYQRIELIRFNLFDNSGTYQAYVTTATAQRGRRGPRWVCPSAEPNYAAVGGLHSLPRAADPRPHAHRHLQRHPQPADGLDGMLSRGTCSSRRPSRTSARRSSRAIVMAAGIGLLAPTRRSSAASCSRGRSRTPTSATTGAAFRDRRRPLRLHEGAVLQRARRVLDPVHDARLVLASRGGPQRRDDDAGGLPKQRAGDVERPLAAGRVERLGCRPDDRIDAAFMAQTDAPDVHRRRRTSYLRARLSHDAEPSPRGGTRRTLRLRRDRPASG